MADNNVFVKFFIQHLAFLLALAKVSNKKQRKTLIQNASRAQMNALRKIMHHFLFSPATDQKIVKKAAPHLKEIKILAEPVTASNLALKKKVTQQSGGFLPLLLPLASSLLMPALGEIFK
jgi:hypothetical protein